LSRTKSRRPHGSDEASRYPAPAEFTRFHFAGSGTVTSICRHRRPLVSITVN
jgi:hypothetical protein